MMRIIKKLIIGMIAVLLVTGCLSDAKNLNAVLVTEVPIDPDPASTLSELIYDISSDNMAVRIVSIYELEKYGPEAVIAIPTLVENLNTDDPDIRKAAAYILGKLGPDAENAISELIVVLQNDNNNHVREEAIKALGLIGNPVAIPPLANELFEESSSFNIHIRCAESIAVITGLKFTDAGTGAYTLSEEGIPLLVVDARKWWKEEGQFQDWSDK